MTNSQQKLPLEFANIFEELNQHMYSLHANWLIFKQLFATNEERVKLLNDFAPIFFRYCQDSFANDIILSIARLTDPIKSSGKNTLSLEQLISKINPTLYSDLRNSIDRQYLALKKVCKPIKNVRNQKLAHNDLLTSLKLNPSLSTIIDKDLVDSILHDFRKLMNTIWEYFNPDVELGYEIIMTNDGEAIVSALEKARKYDQFKRRR
ncbi:MAG: hypothetical protein KIS76_07300 [Pyrinomonadaceae bacterium]|nr:hypothetical protein [Pyrinomonadaceae bacterium]